MSARSIISHPQVYIFFRDEGWYPIELNDDEQAMTNAELNPGTIRVERVDGEIVWVPRRDNNVTV